MVVGGPRRLSEEEGAPLNQGDMRGKGKVPGALVKCWPGEGKALAAEGPSEVSANEQILIPRR